jgi:hypothetical protein
MKLGKFSCLLGLGLAIALLAGCFNPVGLTSTATDAVFDDGSFEVEIAIGQSRSVLGGTVAQIREGQNLYNYLQLVVIDENGNIVAYDDDKRIASNSPAGTLYIDSIEFAKEYRFLLLFGDLPRDYASETPDSNGNVTYVYSAGAIPTLMAAGYKKQYIEGESTVTISMWPLAIDTQIQQIGQSWSDPTPTGAYTEIFQGNGNGMVKWDIGNSQGATGTGPSTGNGLQVLINAQGGGSSLSNITRKYYIDSSQTGTNVSSTSKEFEYNLPSLNAMTDIGTEYGVSFNIEYVPFNIVAPTAWSDFTASVVPRWIIRNGLNDARQNSQTDFAKVGKHSSGYNFKDYNGNGGIWLKVKETLGFEDNDNNGIPDGADDNNGDGFPDAPGSSDVNQYLIYGGRYLGSGSIAFGTKGYTGTAQVYYLVAEDTSYSASTPPAYDQFDQLLGNYAVAVSHSGTVTVPSSFSNPVIWLAFIKDGKVSNRIKIKTGSGNIDIGWGWGS